MNVYLVSYDGPPDEPKAFRAYLNSLDAKEISMHTYLVPHPGPDAVLYSELSKRLQIQSHGVFVIPLSLQSGTLHSMNHNELVDWLTPWFDQIRKRG